MGEYSKVGYFPIKMRKENQNYTMPLYNSLKRYKELRFASNEEQEEDEILQTNLNKIIKISKEIINYHNDTYGAMFNSALGIQKYTDEKLALSRLFFVAYTIEELDSMLHAMKYINYNGEIYFRNEMVKLCDESLNHSVYYKYSNPKEIIALFSDEEYKDGIIKLKCSELIKRVDRLEKITSLTFDDDMIEIFSCIKTDLKDGLDGVFAYIPFRSENEKNPSEIREKYKK